MKPRDMASSLTARVLTVTALLAGVLAVIGAGAAASPAGAASPALTITPTSLDFGSVTLGDVAVQSFVFTNTDQINTDTISPTAAFSGPDGNDFIGVPESSCPNDGTQIVLQPNDTCTVDVVFLPGGLGVRSTTITFSDTLDSGASISLSGTGTIGYYQVSSAGKVASFGDAQLFGDASQLPLNSPIVSMAQTGDNGGYWLVASDGGIFSYGDAGFFGSAGSIHLNKPVVGMASTADGQGYWQVASDGGIFTYGDAELLRFHRLDRTEQAHRGHGADARRRRLLAGGLRRGHLRLRRRDVLRLDRQHPPEPARRGHGADARRRRLLAGGLRRGHLRLRRRERSSARPGPSTSTSPSSA